MVGREAHIHIGESASTGILIVIGFVLVLVSWFALPSAVGLGGAVLGGLIGLGMIVLGFFHLLS